MNGLSPVDAHDDKMLPAVYRRSDIVRSANVAARRPVQGRLDGQISKATEGTAGSGYTRQPNGSSATSRTGNFRKGMIVDVWV